LNQPSGNGLDRFYSRSYKRNCTNISFVPTPLFSTVYGIGYSCFSHSWKSKSSIYSFKFDGHLFSKKVEYCSNIWMFYEVSLIINKIFKILVFFLSLLGVWPFIIRKLLEIVHFCLNHLHLFCFSVITLLNMMVKKLLKVLRSFLFSQTTSSRPPCFLRSIKRCRLVPSNVEAGENSNFLRKSWSYQVTCRPTLGITNDFLFWRLFCQVR